MSQKVKGFKGKIPYLELYLESKSEDTVAEQTCSFINALSEWFSDADFTSIVYTCKWSTGDSGGICK